MQIITEQHRNKIHSFQETLLHQENCIVSGNYKGTGETLYNFENVKASQNYDLQMTRSIQKKKMVFENTNISWGFIYVHMSAPNLGKCSHPRFLGLLSCRRIPRS